jgi:hypothetical protein
MDDNDKHARGGKRTACSHAGWVVVAGEEDYARVRHGTVQSNICQHFLPSAKRCQTCGLRSRKFVDRKFVDGLAPIETHRPSSVHED